MKRPRRLLLAVLLALLAVASLAIVFGRWRSRAPSVPPVAEVVKAARPGRPVILVGLDGADWQLLDRYAASGAMPNLAALVREGAGGVLSSLHPPLSPLVWTTMMTGASPVDHGILDFTRFNPLDGREEPITSDERRLPAVWNMATAAARRVAVVGLWATFPAEAVNGLMVSDRFFPSRLRSATDVSGTVYPPERAAWARAARAAAEDGVGLAQLREYLPWIDEATWAGLAAGSNPYAHPATALRRILVETGLAHALGTEAIRSDRPDLAIVYFEGTDSIGHLFAPYMAPRQSSVALDDFERYQQVPERYFRFMDRLLGEYRRMAAERDAVLFLASDHGFFWGEGRPTRVSSFAPATAAEWHRGEGVYLLWGAGVAPAPGHPGRGSVEQVAATLLALLGMAPSGSGTPLPGAPPDPRPPLDYAAYYHPARAVASTPGTESEEAIEKLRALGYVGGGAGGSGAPRPSGSTRTAASWANESLILRLQGRAEAALEAAQNALAIDPDQATALWSESDLLLARGDADRADPLLVRAFALGLPGGVRYLAVRADAYRRSDQVARATRLLTAAVEARPQDPEAWRLRSAFALERGDCVAARDDAERAERLLPGEPATLGALGIARLCLGDEAGARGALDTAGASLATAHRSLAQAFLARGDLTRAEREARASGEGESETALLLAQIDLGRDRPREAIERLDTLRDRLGASGAGPVPNLAFLRGDALARLGRGADAEAAFREEIRLFPASVPAYQRLALVLSLAGRDHAEVRHLLQSMYDASPRRETATLAARTLRSVGDPEGAAVWEQRVAVPGGPR